MFLSFHHRGEWPLQNQLGISILLIMCVKIQTHKRFKRMLFCQDKTEYTNIWGNPPLSSYKIAQQLMVKNEMVSQDTCPNKQPAFEHFMCLDLVSECYANKHILQLWQSERDEFPDNKLHKIFPVLKECVIWPRTNRKEETVVARWPFFYYSFLFILRSQQCALDVMNI